MKSTLSQHIHDLSGSAVTANGFTGELEIARKHVLELMERLPADTDPELMKEMKFQLEDEMKHCLFRITESLSKLDHTIDRLKAG
ncbi:hypothetical protein ACUNV4_07040 [Granulosicoccus sp. 3-233]|uniref:hypothetical protein n=1 Tax=Granulosicoccus sp. 3-233 TaxID=3417969 RepID=UPI003D34943D